jgi:MFS family permease
MPIITVEYGRLDHVAWYGAAFALSRMVLQPTYGKLAQLFPIKPVFYIANGVLMVGSVICALAPQSEILIFGRAIQGCGAAGIMSTILSMVGFTVSKQEFPFYVSLISSMYTVASLIGPVLGGVFAESYVTWRFCFWINLRQSFAIFPDPTTS